MNINLASVGINKGQQYETIITTNDKNGKRNAAPIGIISRGPDSVMCRIFKGSQTLENILSQKEFIVNITSNPGMFTYATINTIPNEYLTEDNALINADSYFKCELTDVKNAVKKSDLLGKSEAKIIKAKVVNLKINNPCNLALNRAFPMLIESLSNFTRIDLVDKKTQEYYLNRFEESKRVINKVGSAKDKKAILLLKEALKEKGFNI